MKLKFRCPTCGLRFEEFEELKMIPLCPQCYGFGDRVRSWPLYVIGALAVLIAGGLVWFFGFR